MAQNSFALLTNLGRAKEAAALANGTTVTVTHIAIGDGATVPSGGETALYHEVARKTIAGHGTVAGASNVAYFDIFLAAAEGPYTIREAGLYDADGDMIAIARYDPPINKPVPASGQTVEGTIRLEVAFSNVANVTIVVDPSMQVALQRLTRLPWIPVISMSTTAPPASPAVGDTYLVPAAATGAWAGQSGRIAEYTNAGWATMTPPNGHGISLPDGRVFEQIGGTYVEKIAIDAQSGKWSYAVAGGTANALTAALTPTPAAYTAGMAVKVKVAAANTAAATINVNGLGAKPIVTAGGAALAAGDLLVGDVLEVVYDGASFRAASLTRNEIGRDVQSGKWVYAAAGGTANAITAVLAPALAANVAGTVVNIAIANTNTGAATLNAGPGALPIQTEKGAALSEGDLRAGSIRSFINTGAAWRMLGLANSDLGVKWRGVVGFAATGNFDPATYGLTATDKILVIVWGAGGGGASARGGGGSAGGGGGCAIKITTAQSATVTIGAGGAGDTAGQPGGTGGTTSFGSVCSATGGIGGQIGSTGGGNGVGGDVNLQGGVGEDILLNDGLMQWGAGGAAPLMGLSGLLTTGSNSGIGAGGAAYFKASGVNQALNGGSGFALVIY